MKKIVLSLCLLCIAVAGALLFRHQQASAPARTYSNGQAASSFNKKQYSIDEVASLWAVVNKGRALPSSYAPAGLTVPNVPLSEGGGSDNMHVRADTASALESLVNGASGAGIKLMLVSGYRSYSTQKAVYGGYVTSQGQAFADSTSARAGHSEHQTGLAADLGAASRACQLEQCFGDTREGKWLAANAHSYGFIIRYQKGQESLSGYEYEPWHIRYIGKELGAQLYSSGQTMEQFFGLPAYSSYPAAPFSLK
ncbi:MAG: D-alanyl-D-alanine carboxypeptidase [Candidatus Saccharibacteria bacterium]|nr:D-alanyl-D-alanine carboxypeptidase [Candidatus Saccharibacteria bacterium]